MPPATRLLAALAVTSLLVACGDDGDDDEAAETTAPAILGCPETEPVDGITVEGEVGEAPDIAIEDGFEAPEELLVEDLVEGDGEEVPPGATVTVHYVGTLLDGTVFDASFGGTPATFPLNNVIAGWTDGLPCMRIGGRRLLVIPPDLAYGATGQGPIGPDETLVFVVDMLEAAA